MKVQRVNNWQRVYDRVRALEAEVRQLRVELLALQPAAAEVDLEEQKRRAIAAADRFHSGLANLSIEHDHYLVEAYRG